MKAAGWKSRCFDGECRRHRTSSRAKSIQASPISGIQSPHTGGAGIWTPWYSVRKKKEGPVQADIFAFLSTDANEVVKPIHPKAMPVILRTPEELDIWMNAPAAEALQLQRPLPDTEMIVLDNDKKAEPIEEEPTLF
jgi:putative SOS response-associated peptidase YedK